MPHLRKVYRQFAPIPGLVMLQVRKDRQEDWGGALQIRSALSEGRGLRELLSGCCHVDAFAPEEIFDRPS